MIECKHNQICRYTTGFYCADCKIFFENSSPTYRKTELLSEIWMVLNNINVQLYREGKPPDKDVAAMKDKIGIGQKHENYEELIEEAEIVMKKYNKDSESATLKIG